MVILSSGGGGGGGEREMFGTTHCNSFILPRIKLKLGTVIGMRRKTTQTQKFIELLLEMMSR